MQYKRFASFAAGVIAALALTGEAIAIDLPTAPSTAATAPASAPAAPTPSQIPDGWIVSFSAMGAVSPSYPGSSTLRPYPFPSISIRRIGEPERFSTPDEGFGFSVIDVNGFHVGPVANFVFRRGERDGLFGMHSVGLTHEIGGFLEITPNDNFRARAELRQGIDGHHGFVAAFGADVHGSTSGFTMSVGPRLNFGDNRYANAYFSVTPVEAALNGRLTPYQAEGGFTAAGGVATLRYDLTSESNVAIFGGGQRLLGSVGSSPIPNMVGSRNQFTAGLSIGRSFQIQGF